MYELLSFYFPLQNRPREAKRSWEGFAESFSDAIDALTVYASHIAGDLFSDIIILHKSEYLSIFK